MLVLVQVCERGIIVCINGLGLETRNCVKLLDGCRRKASQHVENLAFDLRNLSFLESVDQGVLSAFSKASTKVSCVLAAWSWNSLAVSFLTKGAILLEFISKLYIIS